MMEIIHIVSIKVNSMFWIEYTKLDMEIKTQSCVMVTNHIKAIAMKKNLEQSIAMKELVENKLTMNSYHGIACRIIKSMLEGLQTVTFANIGQISTCKHCIRSRFIWIMARL